MKAKGKLPVADGRLPIANCQLPIGNWKLAILLLLWFSLAATATAASLEATNLPPVAPSLPDVSFSVMRIFGALMLVISLFLGGVWLLRNWQRVARPGGQPAKLQILEMRSLGNRQSVFVLGYEQQRLLVAASPSGITLLDRLPAATLAEAEATIVPASFAETLRKLLPTR
jgi:flagellar biogenesis protein FliO